MRNTFISIFIFLVVLIPMVGCNSSTAPRVIYEEGEPGAALAVPEISPADLGKLRTWQPGNTAGNSNWTLRIL